MKKQSEAQLQMAVARYLDLRGFLWCHVPNGEARNAVTGAKLKKMGVKRGCPDVLIFEPFQDTTITGYTCNANGLAIELKVGKNKPTPAQVAWLEGLTKHGWLCKVCYNIDEVIEWIERCYGK